MSRQSIAHRIPAIDGLRGFLALIVMVIHAVAWGGFTSLLPIAKASVVVFFVLSGYVLTRGWDGRFGLFMLRRFVRLWPTYAVCVVLGFLISGNRPTWADFLWWPSAYPDERAINHPVWSLFVEAWAMPFLPAIVWVGVGSLKRWVFASAGLAAAVTVHPAFVLSVPFILGAALARWELRSRLLGTPFAQWLGRISYSLYLSHSLVFAVVWRLGQSVELAIPAALAAGWLIWWCVERPSILASRLFRGRSAGLSGHEKYESGTNSSTECSRGGIGPPAG